VPTVPVGRLAVVIAISGGGPPPAVSKAPRSRLPSFGRAALPWCSTYWRVRSCSGSTAGNRAVPAFTADDAAARRNSWPASSTKLGEEPTTAVPSSSIEPLSVPKVATHPGLSQLWLRSSRPLSSTSASVDPAAET
jgi:hypothetical protein